MIILKIGKIGLWPFAALGMLTVGTVGASDPGTDLVSADEAVLVQDIVLTHDPLAETELIDDEIEVPSLHVESKDDVKVLDDHELAISADVNIDIEFVESEPLPIVTEIRKLNGLPLRRFKDDQEGCVYFGVGLDGTVGLHGNF